MDPSAVARRRGASMLMMAIALNIVVLSFVGVLSIYGQGFHNVANGLEDQRQAALHARTGIERMLARIRTGELDLHALLEQGPGARAPSPVDGDSHIGCDHGEHDAATLFAFEDEAEGHRVELVALDVGSSGFPGDPARRWLRVDAHGFAGQAHKTLSRYLRPGGSASRIPLFGFGIAAVRQLRLDRNGWFEVDAFDSRTDPFAFTPSSGHDWEDLASDIDRYLGYTDARVLSLGQIRLAGQVWGDAYSSFEYRHPAAASLDLDDHQLWGDEHIDGETGLFQPDVYASLSQDPENGDLITAAVLGPDGGYGRVTGNLKVGKGDVAVEQGRVDGDLWGGQTLLGTAEGGVVGGATRLELGLEPSLEVAGRGPYTAGARLLNHLLDDARLLAVERGAGTWDDHVFRAGSFERPAGVPVRNEAWLASQAGRLGYHELGYDPEQHLIVGGLVLRGGDAPPIHLPLMQTLEAPGGDGVFLFEDLSLLSPLATLLIDNRAGPVEIHVRDDIALLSGHVQVLSDQHAVTIVQGGIAGNPAEAPEGMQTGDHDIFLLTTRLRGAGPLRVAAAHLVIEHRGRLEADNLELSVSGNLRLGDQDTIVGVGIDPWAELEVGWVSPGEIRVHGDAHIAVGGPAGNHGFGGVLLRGNGRIAVDGDLRLELHGEAGTEISGSLLEIAAHAEGSLGGLGGGLDLLGEVLSYGTDASLLAVDLGTDLADADLVVLADQDTPVGTGVLQLANGSRVDVGGDLDLDAVGLWLSGSEASLRVGEDGYLFLQEALTIAHASRFENETRPLKVFVDLDNTTGLLSPYGYLDPSEERDEPFLLRPRDVAISHQHDLWAGVFAPHSRVRVLDDISWYGAAIAGLLDVGDQLSSFRQDYALIDVGAAGYAPSYDDILANQSLGPVVPAGTSLLGYLQTVTLTVELGEAQPGDLAQDPQAVSLLQLGSDWHSGAAGEVPQLFRVDPVTGRVLADRVADFRIEWCCGETRRSVRGNLDAAAQHATHADDHLGSCSLTLGRPGSGPGYSPVGRAFDPQLQVVCPH